MSKNRPSPSSRAVAQPKRTAAYWAERLFKNSYTYRGRQRRVHGWSVKIQHGGQRRTLALGGRSRAEAAREALQLFQTILSEGWSAVDGSRRKGGAPSPRSAAYWRPRLIRRQYTEWLRDPPKPEWSVYVEHEGRRQCFPLGTEAPSHAAEHAARIYGVIEDAGWETACRTFERELALALFWSFNPLAYTYATLFTRIDNSVIDRPRVPVSGPALWIIEPDREIRAALGFWISRHAARHPLHLFKDTEHAAREWHRAPRPGLILINRLIRDGSLSGAERLWTLDRSLPIVNYGLFEDSTQLFLAFGGVQAGYVLRRTRPDEILVPCGFGLPAARATLEERVKRYFQSFFEQAPAHDALPAFALLTEREREILDALTKGYVDKEIAEALGISAWTVHSHFRNIFEKLHVRTRTEAVVRYLQH